MSRRSFLKVLAAGLAAGRVPAVPGQPAGKVFRIGLLANTIPMADLVARVASRPEAVVFEEELKKLGWKDGLNIRIVWRSAEGRLERLPALAEELVRHPVDVIVAFGPGVYSASKVTRTIPIVGVNIPQPVEGGLAASLARPGGNVTGTSLGPANPNPKLLSLLKEAVPRTSRVAFIGTGGFSAETTAAATALHLSLVKVAHGDPHDLRPLFAESVRQGANGLVIGEDPALRWKSAQEGLYELTTRHRLPTIQSLVIEGEIGSLVSYGPDVTMNTRRVSLYVDKILRGARPGELPIDEPEKYVLVVNLKAARAMGLALPRSLLLQADRVIE